VGFVGFLVVAFVGFAVVVAAVSVSLTLSVVFGSSVTTLFTVWNVDNLSGISVVTSNFVWPFVVAIGVVSLTPPLSTSGLDSSSGSVLSCKVSDLSVVASGVFSVVVFLLGNKGLLTVVWVLSSVCGWTKLEPSIELSSILLPIIWGSTVLSGI
jgi:hypothetical protein